MNGYLIDVNLPTPRSYPTKYRMVESRTIFGPEADDAALWNYARDEHLAIVTKDTDFTARILTTNPPPWVVHVRVGNMRRTALHAFLAQHWKQIESHLPRHKLVLVFSDRIVGAS